jgi:hypothetical protein
MPGANGVGDRLRPTYDGRNRSASRPAGRSALGEVPDAGARALDVNCRLRRLPSRDVDYLE